VSSNTLMPATVSPSHSDNFDTVMVLSLGSGSLGFSASSRALCFRISELDREWDPHDGISTTRRHLPPNDVSAERRKSEYCCIQRWII
jgi:hypothetical protein